jgi:uncharacterized protein YbjT (DUF2867 family)
MTETIALFGATGETGREVLAAALEQGKKVHVMVRNPAKLVVKEHANLVVVEGDCFASDAKSKIEQTVKGTDYVISCIGGQLGKPKEYPVGEVLNFVKELVEVIQNTPSIKTFLFQSGAFVPHPDGSHPLSMKLMAKVVGEWLVGIGPNLKENKDIQDYLYTMLDKVNFKIIVTRPGGLVKSEGGAKVVARSAPPFGMTAFKDLAMFTLEAVKEESLYGTYPFVGVEESEVNYTNAVAAVAAICVGYMVYQQRK